MTVDTYSVLNGTDQKRFDNARAELAKDYTQSAAREFYYEYQNRPLSFLLRNSRNIFSETYYGLDFYRDLISHQILNPMAYASELDKVKAFINEAKAKRLPTEQVMKYIELAKLLEDKCGCHKNLAHVFKRAHTFPGAPEYFTQFFDLLNDKSNDYSNHLASDIFDNSKDPSISIPAGYCLCVKHPHYCGHLMKLSSHGHNLTDPEAIRRKERTRMCIREMMQDEDVRKNTASFPNINLYPKWVVYAESVDKLPEQKLVTEAAERNIMLAANPIEAIYEAVEDRELIEKAQLRKYSNLDELHSYLAVYVESLQEEVMMGERSKDDPTLAYYEDAFEQAEVGMACMEWESDGSPNAVIQKQIMTSKERAAQTAKKEAEKNQIRSEEDSLSIIKETEKDLLQLEKDDLDEEEQTKRAKALRDELSAKLHKEILSYPEVKAAMVKIDNLVTEISSYTEDGDEKDEKDDDPTQNVDDENAPSDKDPNQKKPKKPKEDLPTKVQNKALDADAKMTAKEAEIDEKAQKFKNAGNAIAQHPKKLAADVDQTIQNFDKWDDNRRKNFLLKPGYRHRIFKKFLNVLEYGAAASIGITSVPMLWCIKHLSKQKDKRIRNELALELDNEIKICEEKISDAQSDGDREKKYQLMRIKDKLEAERTRVRTNSKYV
jgi:hypothetical protein